MDWFRGRRTRTKLFMCFGLMTVFVLATAVLGHQALASLTHDLTAMYQEQFLVALSIADTGSSLNAVRATLLAMLAAPDRAAQDKLHARVKELSQSIDAKFDALLGGGLDAGLKARIATVREPWTAFRETRDRELIPAIYAGRAAEARALAAGVQAERFRAFSVGAGRLIEEQSERALRRLEEGQRRAASSVAMFVGLAALTVAAGIVLAFLLGAMIAGPLQRTAAAFKDIAEGEGDLTRRLPATSGDEVGEVARWFNTFMDKLHDIIVQSKQAAEHVATASRELAGAADQLASGSQEQASSLEETASSLEEITGTVKQNADNARQADQLASGTRRTADQGGQVVGEAIGAMAEINRSSAKIADIITTIDEIAFQTNLLALNAAVEAARAGEQGRGFAVVAAEVRNLARRSATAAKEIKGLIQDSVGKVEAGSELVNKSGATLQEIVSSVKRVTDIIAEIAAASREQSTGIEQVNQAVTQMDQVVQANAAQTEEMSSTAQALAEQAGRLQELVGRFKVAGYGVGVARPTLSAPPPPIVRRVAVKRAGAKPVPVEAVGAHAANGHADGFEEF